MAEQKKREQESSNISHTFVRQEDSLQAPSGGVNSNPFSDRAKAALTAWREAHKPGQFGTHNYARDDFGQSREQIHERYAEYIERYPRVLETRERSAA